LQHCVSDKWQQGFLNVGRCVLHNKPGRVRAVVANSVPTWPARARDNRAHSLEEWLIGGRHGLQGRIALCRLPADAVYECPDTGAVPLIELCEVKELRAKSGIEPGYSTQRVVMRRSPLWLSPK